MAQDLIDIDTASFASFASAYERVIDPVILPTGRWALDLAKILPGDRLIILSAASGAIALAAAERGASVTATDIIPEMVARAGIRLAKYDGCSAQIMRPDVLAASEGEFDAALSMFGMQDAKSSVRSLRELVRVTRPGGIVAVAGWDQRRLAAPHYFASDVFAKTFPGRTLWPEQLYPQCSKEEILDLMKKAGCKRTKGVLHEGIWTVSSPIDVMIEC